MARIGKEGGWVRGSVIDAGGESGVEKLIVGGIRGWTGCEAVIFDGWKSFAASANVSRYPLLVVFPGDIWLERRHEMARRRNNGDTSRVEGRKEGKKGERGTCGEARRGRGNYVFRESTELPSTEELWISALPRCRCEEGHSALGYVFHWRGRRSAEKEWTTGRRDGRAPGRRSGRTTTSGGGTAAGRWQVGSTAGKINGAM